MDNYDFKRRLLYQIMLVVMLGVLAIAGCYGGDNNGGGGTAQQTPTQQLSQQPSSVPVSFIADIQPIFTQNCATVGCHNATTRSGGLVLDAGVAFVNIVQVPSGQVPSQNYVESGAPDSSYLFRKITGAPG